MISRGGELFREDPRISTFFTLRFVTQQHRINFRRYSVVSSHRQTAYSWLLIQYTANLLNRYSVLCWSLWRMRRHARHGPVIAQCTDSEDFPSILITHQNNLNVTQSVTIALRWTHYIWWVYWLPELCTNGLLPNQQHVTVAMNHIVDTCPLTKFEGGLQLLYDYEAEEDAVKCLESVATTSLAIIKVKTGCLCWVIYC